MGCFILQILHNFSGFHLNDLCIYRHITDEDQLYLLRNLCYVAIITNCIFAIVYLLLSSGQNIRVRLTLCGPWLVAFTHAENNFGSLFTHWYMKNSKASTNDLIKLWYIHMAFHSQLSFHQCPIFIHLPLTIKPGAHKIFQKPRIHLKILGPRTVTWSKFHTGDPQILCCTIQNVVAQTTWCQGFTHPRLKV